MERPELSEGSDREVEISRSVRDSKAASSESLENSQSSADDDAALKSVSKYALTAYIAPFAAFLVLTSVEQWEPLPPWYPAFYTLKIGVVLGLWWMFRRHYPGISADGAGWGVLAGIVGVVAWILLAQVRLDAVLPEWLAGWFVGARAAYNPFEAIASPGGQWAFVAVRLFGLAVVVPLMEEVFWRGFLIRYLVADDFERVPMGRMTPTSFIVVTVLFAAVHPEVLAALVWGAGVNWLLFHTRNLWACIVAHAATNLLLGVYVLTTGAWHLW